MFGNINQVANQTTAILTDMHHYGKYTGKKASKSPLQASHHQRQRNQDPVNIDLHQFRDTNSSIRFDSKLDCQRVEALITQYTDSQYEAPGIFGELATLHHYPDHQVKQSSEALIVDKSHMKSQQEIKSLTPNLKYDRKREKFNRKKSTEQNSHSGNRSKKRLASSNSRISKLNDRIIHNHNQVAMISLKAQQVTEQLMKMKELEQSLPLSISHKRHSSKISKSPSMLASNNVSLKHKFMKPTESAMLKSLGKATSKQRLMELYEFLEHDETKAKKQEQRKPSTQKSGRKSGRKFHRSSQEKLNTVNVVKKNRPKQQRDDRPDLMQEELMRKMEECTRIKQAAKLKKSAAGKRSSKVKLFLDPPKLGQKPVHSRQERRETHAHQQNTTVCKRNHLRLESETEPDDNINLVALNKEAGLQQYLNCKAQYNSLVKDNSLVKPDKKQRKTTQEIVHQRVKQMQNKYQQVFKNQDNERQENERRETEARETLTYTRKTRSKKSDEIFYRTEGRNATKSSLEWNGSASNDFQINERDRKRKQLRNSIGNQYMKETQRSIGKSGNKNVNKTQMIASPKGITYEDPQRHHHYDDIKQNKTEPLCQNFELNKRVSQTTTNSLTQYEPKGVSNFDQIGQHLSESNFEDLHYQELTSINMFEKEKLGTGTRESERHQQVFKDEPPQSSEQDDIDQQQIKDIVREVKLQASKEKDKSRQRKLGTAQTSSRMTDQSKRSRRSHIQDMKFIHKREKKEEKRIMAHRQEYVPCQLVAEELMIQPVVCKSPPQQESSKKLEQQKKKSPEKPMNEEQKMKLMQKRLRFLHSHFGAVMKGYKTRRIFHNNSGIRKIRLEFREIIQFAYNLKKDIEHSNIDSKDEIKQLLITSLKELMHKRSMFSQIFHKLLECKGQEEVAWIRGSQPREIQQLAYDDVFLRKERSRSANVRRDRSEPRVNASLSPANRFESSANFTAQSVKSTLGANLAKQHRAITEKNCAYSNSLNHRMMTKSRDGALRPHTQHLVGKEDPNHMSSRQMTFGNNTLNQSRNMSVQKHTENERESLRRANTHFESLQGNLNTIQVTTEDEDQVSSPVRPFHETQEDLKSNHNQMDQQAVKKEYLRKGSNTRHVYDPLKSIEQEKERKKHQKEKEKMQRLESLGSVRDEPVEAESRSPIHRNHYISSNYEEIRCTPIKEDRSKDNTLLQTSAQRISDLKEKYSANQMSNGRLTPIKHFAQATKMQLEPAEFVSKIPRLNCSIDREQKERVVQTKPQDSASSIVQMFRRANASHDVTQKEQTKSFTQEHSMQGEHRNRSKNNSKDFNSTMNNQKTQHAASRHQPKAETSCSSYLTCNQIPVMSPGTKRINNEDKTMSEYNVQNIESYYQSEVHSKHGSPSKPVSPSKKSKSTSLRMSILTSHQQSKSRQNFKMVEASQSSPCSPALSIDKKHMNEILKRCSPLKRTTYANPFLQVLETKQGRTFGSDVMDESKAADVKATSILGQARNSQLTQLTESTNKFENPVTCQEVKILSPEPEPAQLQVTKVKMDMSSSPIRDCIDNHEETQSLRMASSAKKRVKTTRDASDWLNVDYKLKILGVNDIDKQNNEPGIFDINVQAFNMAQSNRESNRSKTSQHEEAPTLPHRNPANRDFILDKLAANPPQYNSKHSNSNSTFRIQPQKVYNASTNSIVSMNTSKQQLEKPESPVSHYKRTKYSPQKKLRSPNKENVALTMVKSALALNHNYNSKHQGNRTTMDFQKDEKNRRRSRGERKQRSQNKYCKSNKLVLVSYQHSLDNDGSNNDKKVLNESSWYCNAQQKLHIQFNDLDQSYESPSKQGLNNSKKFKKGSCSKFEMLGYVKRSSSKSPVCSILEEKGRHVSRSRSKLSKSRQTMLNSTSDEVPHQYANGPQLVIGDSTLPNACEPFASLHLNDAGAPLNLQLQNVRAFDRVI